MKPRIVYIDGAPPVVGKGVWLLVKGHPRLGSGWIRTSRVLAVTNGPCIETFNSVYVPYDPFNLKPARKVLEKVLV
jgi:hypothetical protein